MRKNTREVFRAWSEGRAKQAAPSIWTDGENIYSYGTCIVARIPAKFLEGYYGHGDRYAMNVTSYSTTTSTHQNALRDVLYRPAQVLVDYMPQGVKAEQLVAAATAPADVREWEDGS